MEKINFFTHFRIRSKHAPSVKGSWTPWETRKKEPSPRSPSSSFGTKISVISAIFSHLFKKFLSLSLKKTYSIFIGAKNKKHEKKIRTDRLTRRISLSPKFFSIWVLQKFSKNRKQSQAVPRKTAMRTISSKMRSLPSSFENFLLSVRTPDAQTVFSQKKITSKFTKQNFLLHFFEKNIWLKKHGFPTPSVHDWVHGTKRAVIFKKSFFSEIFFSSKTIQHASEALGGTTDSTWGLIPAKKWWTFPSPCSWFFCSFSITPAAHP